MGGYKLTYFDMRGRAEPLRILFALADVPYEDIRVQFADFPALKEKLPYGQLPILQVPEGPVLSQSVSIARYLSRKFGFHGKTDLEAAQIDEFCDACGDYGQGYGAIRQAKDEETKAAAEKNFSEVLTPKYFTKFSQILEANGGKFVVGDSLTLADLILFNLIDFFEAATQIELTKGYPTLKTFSKNVAAVPKIRDWIQKRPQTKM